MIRWVGYIYIYILYIQMGYHIPRNNEDFHKRCIGLHRLGRLTGYQDIVALLEVTQHVSCHQPPGQLQDPKGRWAQGC